MCTQILPSLSQGLLFTSNRETEAKAGSGAIFLMCSRVKTEEQFLKKMHVKDYNSLTESVLGCPLTAGVCVAPGPHIPCPHPPHLPKNTAGAGWAAGAATELSTHACTDTLQYPNTSLSSAGTPRHVFPWIREGFVLLCFDAITLCALGGTHRRSRQVRPLDRLCEHSLGSATPGRNAGKPKRTWKACL